MKKEVLKDVSQVFKSLPKTKSLYVSEDGNIFSQKNHALNYQRKSGLKFEEVLREEIEKPVTVPEPDSPPEPDVTIEPEVTDAPVKKRVKAGKTKDTNAKK